MFSARGERFLFLKKRNKRHCGTDDQSEKRYFPVHSAWNEKTDGSHTNRPFCVTHWRKQQKQRRTTVPQMIFFCFFSSKKKRRRFTYEPSVLCIKLAEAAGEQRDNCLAIDFLLLPFLSRKKREDEEKEKKGRMRRSQSRANRSFSLRDRRLIKRSRRSASACPAHCSV